MVYLCIRYKVGDFLKWHEAFVRNEDLRIAAGIKVENILRSQNDRNKLTILYAIDSMVAANDFIQKATTNEMKEELTIVSDISISYYDVFY